ncbi:hypothetical protein HG535_0F06100 [Zygotorulaspora mrakii]|uniref:Sugar utilization regulatory protein IMP2 n=1 Tax=Zygotorulaspora mrakii TaxID=42260 RepID=A0A7H9B5W0_ZYGMR|nr:uncharacterized protein HG535_0F06100 [Zygotorulaspora mrakii]QLG74098.1 hypothetical protein HG535_0F06100 [Zygotorulaspora mrakii]
MSGIGHKSILLTSPDGDQSPLHHSHGDRELSPTTSSGIAATDRPTECENQSRHAAAVAGSAAGSTGVQFDADQLERGRSRTKFLRQNSNNGVLRSVSRSRSRSCASVRIKDEEFLKWTVLRRDPSMRLKLVSKNARKNKAGSREANEESEDSNEDDEDEDEDEDEDSLGVENDDDDCSDEEQVLDVENDYDIDKEFHYDLGMKVLPNFVISLNEVLESSKAWIRKYDASIAGKETEGVTTETLSQDYIKSMQVLTKGKGASDEDSHSYILFADLSSESQYALTYVMGSVIGNGDTLYLLNCDNSRYGDEAKIKIQSNVIKLRSSVMHMFDCVSAVIDDLDVVVLSLQHPYPKHLLTEMIFGLKPVALCCSLSMILSTLQNFVCSVPTLVIRKKLKRSKKKGISE